MTHQKATDLNRYRARRERRGRNQRMLNNLPMAHRLACSHAETRQAEQELLGQAMVGLVRAADSFEPADTDERFGAYAEPHIERALESHPPQGEVEVAQAEIAEAISSQERVQELAAFLDVPVDALVGGLMDVTARERVFSRYRPLRDVA